ncbi:nitrate/nitrite transporter NrtS [Xanthobacter autotrophicus]|uniref:nitrate/nitrite transporter NrtS n=1 Tax=Xanthobacter TaxID=279 RepID=UPI0024AAE51C|nr:nitrate/nitrite transporter NrtS [Xanthobacter autotrophicus]MDI4663704.1 nitrate/nitrite transporter NrtS [Xanthobacter autotrophicus]
MADEGSGRHPGGIMIMRFLSHALESGIPRRSFGVAAVVGTVLNLINQGDAMVGGRALDWTKIALTFIVPYCVATYGAVSYRLRQERDANCTGAPPRSPPPATESQAEDATPDGSSRERARRYTDAEMKR